MEELSTKRTELIKEEEPETNKVPHWASKIAAGLIDLGLLLAITFGFVKAMRLTPMGHECQGYKDQVMYIQKDYGTTPLLEYSDETLYHKVYLTEENKDNHKGAYIFTDEPGKTYVLENNTTADKNVLEKLQKAYNKKLEGDKKYTAAKFNYRLVNYGIYVISISMAQAILILGVPLINKRRATLGQLAAGIRVLNSNVPSKARWYKIVWRYFYVMIMEVAIPVLGHLSIYSLLLVPLISYILSLFNKNRRAIRDYATRTILIDNKTYESIDGSK